MKLAQPKLKSGFVPVVVVAIVLAVSTAVVVFALRNYKGVTNAETAVATNDSTCRADVTQDGVVDQRDLQAVANAFNQKSSQFDISGDGTVNVLDLSILSKEMGKKCATNATLADQAGCVADVNLDGAVDQTDLQTLANNYGKPGKGDINGDGIINVIDLSLIARAMGGRCTTNGSNVCAISDVNHDSIVDAKDLQLVAGDFGKKGSVYDVNVDGIVNVIDLSVVARFNGQKCSSIPTPSAPTTSALTSPKTTGPVVVTACSSDVNKDGIVNSGDQGLIAKNYGTVNGSSIYDLNGDGSVNVLDLSKSASFFNQKCESNISSSNTTSSAVTACSSDVNKDGTVNSSDLGLISKNNGVTGSSIYDLNKDGSVTTLDVNAASGFFNQKCESNNSSSNTTSSAVTACSSDVNKDGTVNVIDLQLIAKNNGVTGSSIYDLNKDGSVTTLDVNAASGFVGQKC